MVEKNLTGFDANGVWMKCGRNCLLLVVGAQIYSNTKGNGKEWMRIILNGIRRTIRSNSRGKGDSFLGVQGSRKSIFSLGCRVVGVYGFY